MEYIIPTSGLSTLFTIVFGKMGMYWVLLFSDSSPSNRQNSKKSSRISYTCCRNLFGVFFWAPLPFKNSSDSIKLDLFQIYGLFPFDGFLELLKRNQRIKKAGHRPAFRLMVG